MSKFAEHIFLYSPLYKNLLETAIQHPEVLEDLLHGFCLRNHIIPEWQLHLSDDMIAVTLFVETENESLSLYREWHKSWREHGYDSPILDISIKDD